MLRKSCWIYSFMGIDNHIEQWMLSGMSQEEYNNNYERQLLDWQAPKTCIVETCCYCCDEVSQEKGEYKEISISKDMFNIDYGHYQEAVIAEGFVLIVVYER